ncbi:DUF4157 domain-containing protein, partial [Natronolimnobius sp. AArcel1]|nr:DUF4157 domain-containing protein [Natronolimnobius sp. AArcel1]
LEDRLGESLDHVRVHTGPTAQQACEAVNARAFTVGNHIAFGPGEYDPQSTAGQHLITHEVVHTLQQPDAPLSMMPKTEPQLEIDPDEGAEREADEIATEVMKGGKLGITSMWQTDVHIQRWGLSRAVTGTADRLSKFKATMDENLSSRTKEKQDRAQKFAEMGQRGDGSSIPERVDSLEQDVSELGTYVADQVSPTGLGQKIRTAVTDNVVATGAGLTVGGAMAYTGLQNGSPELVTAGVSAASTAATTAYAQHRGPDVAHAAKEMSPDWMKQVSGFVK